MDPPRPPLVKLADDGDGLFISGQKFHCTVGSRIRRLGGPSTPKQSPNNELREKFKRKMDAICRVKKERPKLGILAYGSLLKDPGKELKGNIVERIRVETPFEVEYARTSKGRAGAPTIVPVSDGKGGKVHAYILILKPHIGEEGARNMLYRREINCMEEKSVVYDDKCQRGNKDSIVIKRLENFGGVAVVLYTSLRANIEKVLQVNISAEEKAKELASLAVESVTRDIFCSQRDGIRYLVDAIYCGIRTPLTEVYKQEILSQASDAPNLEKARLRIARQKGVLL